MRVCVCVCVCNSHALVTLVCMIVDACSKELIIKLHDVLYSDNASFLCKTDASAHSAGHEVRSITTAEIDAQCWILDS